MEAAVDRGEDDGPFAGAPLLVREIRMLRPGFQAVPLLFAELPRNVTNTSFIRLLSPDTRSDASDSYAIARS